MDELNKLLNYDSDEVLNNTVIINELIYDLCTNSTPEKGLCFSNRMFNIINKIKDFNYRNIYSSDKLKVSHDYFEIVLTEIYKVLKVTYNDKDIANKICLELVSDFENWVRNYWNLERDNKNNNNIIFDIKDKKEYYRAIIFYISGMTDNYAINMYNKIIGF